MLEAEAHQCGINYLPREKEDGWGYGEGGPNGKNEEDGLEKGAQEKPGPNGKLVAQEVVAECQAFAFERGSAVCWDGEGLENLRCHIGNSSTSPGSRLVEEIQDV